MGFFSKLFNIYPHISFLPFREEGIKYKLGFREIFIGFTATEKYIIYAETISDEENLTQEEKSKIFHEVILFTRKKLWSKPIVEINIDKEKEFWIKQCELNSDNILQYIFNSNAEKEKFLYDMYLRMIQTGLEIDGKEIKSKEDLDIYWQTRDEI